MSKIEEHFQSKAEEYAAEFWQHECHGVYQTRNDYLAGEEYGYKYAVEHSDDVIRLIVRMAKKDIAFTEEESVKYYRQAMED